jgi:hypothetical protein
VLRGPCVDRACQLTASAYHGNAHGPPPVS